MTGFRMNPDVDMIRKVGKRKLITVFQRCTDPAFKILFNCLLHQMFESGTYSKA